MPIKDTPAKHMTPNYKQVAQTYFDERKNREVVYAWKWVAQPLRADRKDLAALTKVPA